MNEQNDRMSQQVQPKNWDSPIKYPEAELRKEKKVTSKLKAENKHLREALKKCKVALTVIDAYHGNFGLHEDDIEGSEGLGTVRAVQREAEAALKEVE